MINKFQYCPNCKNKLKKISNRLVDCSVCGFHFYLNPTPANALIIENKNHEILLVKRKFNPKKGYWDLPGGFVETKETIEDSLKREIKEELNINISKFNYFGSYPGNYLYKNLNYQTLCFVFTGIIDNQIPKPDDDAEEIKFFKKEKIPFKKLAFIEVKNALKDYLKK